MVLHRQKILLRLSRGLCAIGLVRSLCGGLCGRLMRHKACAALCGNLVCIHCDVRCRFIVGQVRWRRCAHGFLQKLSPIHAAYARPYAVAYAVLMRPPGGHLPMESCFLLLSWCFFYIVCLWFSYRVPIVSLLFSYCAPVVFLVRSYCFLIVILLCSHCCTIVFLLRPHCFPIVLLSFLFCFLIIFGLMRSLMRHKPVAYGRPAYGA